MDRSLRLLLVDPDAPRRAALALALEAEGAVVIEAGSVDAALARLSDLDAVLADLAASAASPADDTSAGDALGLLFTLQGERPSLPVLLLTERPTIELTVRALHAGAHDLIQRGASAAQLLAAAHRAARRHRGGPASPRERETGDATLVGGSPPMVEVYRQVALAARSRAPVLITGESGTGKELVARAIHLYSAQRDHALVAVNCGALPEPLLESELFGHVRGAFTGAERDREGLIRQASGGTLFLDEIGEISPRLQVQLLRVLQEGEIRPVGSDRSIHVSVRIIAATHQELERRVEDGRFRQDLYYRLKVVVIRVPPLRDRPDDVPRLIDRFLARAERELLVEPEALAVLQAYAWPGNVRELENVIARAAALSPGPMITVDDLPPEVRGDEADDAPDRGVRTLAAVEADYARRILARCRGNKSRAARLLGIDRKTLSRVLAR